MKSKFTILLFTIFSTTVLVLVIIYNKTQSQSYISTHYSNNKIKTTATLFYMVMVVANAQKRLWSNKR
ncbi:hypothetical protein ACUXHF_001890 [Staphylococcus epidermidis]|jgi:hypothetical protein